MNAKYTLLTKKKNDSVLMRDKQVYGSLAFSDDDNPRDPLMGHSKHSGVINKKKRSHGRHSNDDIELKAVRARTGESLFSDEIVLLVRDILPSDTLQSFSLLYGCTVSWNYCCSGETLKSLAFHIKCMLISHFTNESMKWKSL